ncbi:hypothetical protein D3C75_917450 [compost metagenome]
MVASASFSVIVAITIILPLLSLFRYLLNIAGFSSSVKSYPYPIVIVPLAFILGVKKGAPSNCFIRAIVEAPNPTSLVFVDFLIDRVLPVKFAYSFSICPLGSIYLKGLFFTYV